MRRRAFLSGLGALALVGTLPPVSQRLIICDGNSITDYTAPLTTNHFSWQPWPMWLQRMTAGYVVNVAVAATNIDHCDDRAPVTIDPLIGLTPETWLIIFEGTNHLQSTAGDALATYAAHVKYCNARRAAGVDRIFIGTIISRNTSQYTEAQRLQFNDLIRQNYHTFADGVIDFAAIAEMGGALSWQDERYFYDGVHPTDIGSQLLAQRALADLRPIPSGTIPQKNEIYFPIEKKE